MPLIVQDLIEEARDAHPAFSPQRTPARPLLRFLSAWQRQVRGKMLRVNTGALNEVFDVALPLDDHAAGFALPGAHYRRAGVVVGVNGSESPFTLIPAGHRNDPGLPVACGWLIGDTLFLRPPAALWRNVAKVTLEHAPIPDALQAPTDALALPDSAEAAAVAALVEHMGDRGLTPKEAEVSSPIPAAKFAARAAELLEAFLTEIAGQQRAVLFRVREVW